MNDQNVTRKPPERHPRVWDSIEQAETGFGIHGQGEEFVYVDPSRNFAISSSRSGFCWLYEIADDGSLRHLGGMAAFEVARLAVTVEDRRTAWEILDDEAACVYCGRETPKISEVRAEEPEAPILVTRTLSDGRRVEFVAHSGCAAQAEYESERDREFETT